MYVDISRYSNWLIPHHYMLKYVEFFKWIGIPEVLFYISKSNLVICYKNK